MARPVSTLALAFTATLATLATGCDDEAPLDPADPVEEFVREVRQATELFHDLGTALDAGYEQLSPCVETPEGAMGFHYGRGALIDDVVQPTEPELLLYLPSEDGRMELVGVEYMVMAPTWDAAHDGPPTLLGVPFADHRAEELRHGLPFPHYDLHAWVWETNPSGTFAPYNPALSCEFAGE